MSKLFVDSIEPKTTGGDITIPSFTGSTLQKSNIPSQVAFLAKKLGGSNVTSGIVDFETIVLNVGNGYSNSTYKFTAPVAGIYQLQCFCLTTSTASANDLQIMINDVRYAQARIDVGSVAHNTISMATIASLSVGNTVHMNFANSGGISASEADWNNFSGYLIGAAS